jgi:methylated-DNA-protein-cysteine methyltransferase-like protein
MSKNSKELVFKFVAKIPKGKVMTYGQISKKLEINSPRAVGQILHKNVDPKNIPCHRVVFVNGRLSKSYAFGGEKIQKEKLEKEGIKFIGGKVDLKKHLLK